MAIFRTGGPIPRNRRNADSNDRRKKLVPKNSFYVAGSGKTYKHYLEAPEIRRIAGIKIKD